MGPEAGGCEALFLVAEGPGSPHGFPSAAVLQLQPWRSPMALPLCAGGMLGWLPDEGQATPVLDGHTLFGTGFEAAALLLLESAAGRYFLPVNAARFVRAAVRPPPEGCRPFVAGALSLPDGREVALVEPELLYRAFLVGYNPPMDGIGGR